MKGKSKFEKVSPEVKKRMQSWRIIVHTFKTSPIDYVDEKLKEAGINIDEDEMLLSEYYELHRKQTVYKVVNYFNIFFTVVSYWIIMGGVISSALAPFAETRPELMEGLKIVGIVLLVFFPISAPGLAITSILKSFLYLDVDHSKTFVLGLIASVIERKRSSKS